MKAIILAGGEGTRLRPLTENIPKALIPLQGITLTEHVINILKKQGIKEIYLSVAYKKEMIKNYFKNGNDFGCIIEYIEEDEPLGTAGPLIILNREKRKIHETFFMVNGDNLFDVNLLAMYSSHKANRAHATIGLTKVEDAKSFGVPILHRDKILSFLEKPDSPPSNWINSGYYVLEPEIFELVENKTKAMMEKDIFPALAQQNKLYAYLSDTLWFDTGTLERYQEAEKNWKIK